MLLPPPRCPNCAARRHVAPERDWLRCGHCGLAFAATLTTAAFRDALGQRLATGSVDLRERPDGWTMDVFTLRIAASAHGRCVRPTGPAQAGALRAPHSALPAVAATPRLAGVPSRPISLAVLARAGDLARAAALVEAFPGADDRFVVLDAERAPPGPGPRTLAHPLDGDFAAQRNRAQQAARHDWVLQLDADETLESAAVDLLARLARVAERQGVLSIGLPRRNLVDGVASDLFPDVQYRLNRRGVRYAGRVHERPAVPWQRTTIALAAPIDHHLGRARVAERALRYEAMQPGAGMPEHAAALLRAFAP